MFDQIGIAYEHLMHWLAPSHVNLVYWNVTRWKNVEVDWFWAWIAPPRISSDIVLPYLQYYWCQVALLAVILLGTTWYMFQRAFSTIAKTAMLVLSVVIVLSTIVVDYKVGGLPSILRMPEYVQIVGVDVREPTSTDKGHIAYWTRGINKTTRVIELSMPRAHILAVLPRRRTERIPRRRNNCARGRRVIAQTTAEGTVLPSSRVGTLGDGEVVPGMKFKDDLLGERLQKETAPDDGNNVIQMEPDR